MCGIIGFVTAEKPKSSDAGDRMDFISQGLIIDTLRGWDAAGAFGALMSERRKAGYVKNVGSGFALQTTKNWAEVFGGDKGKDYRYVVGHNRAATQGGRELDAAHPFQEGNITLVHNGSLPSTHTLPRSQHMTKAVNDSHTICHNLAEFEAMEVLQSINGPFTLVWHDAEDDSLNIARNPERPLYLAKAAKHNTVYFASEGWMLYGLDERIGIGLQQIVSLQPYYWLKFTPEGGIKPKITPFEKYQYRPSGRQHINYHQEWTGALAQQDTEFTPTTTHPKMENVVQMAQRPRGTKVGTTTISDSVQLQLMEVDLDIEQNVEFMPMLGEEILRPKDSATYVVTGRLRRLPTDKFMTHAIIYGVLTPVWKAANDRIWTVRPAGIKYSAQGEPIVICRYVKSTNLAGRAEDCPRPTSLYATPAIESSDLIRPNGEFKLYPGPNGSFLRFGEWKRAVEGGCITCGSAIHPRDAGTMQWVNERKDPLCGSCVDDYNNGNKTIN